MSSPGPTTPSQTSTPDPELEQLRLLVLAAQREGTRQLSEKLRPADLTPAQAEILHVLGLHPGITLAELGGFIVCESGSPSRAVDLLVRRALVSRVQSTHDRRFVDLELTAAGQGLLPVVRQAFAAVDDGVAQALPRTQRHTMIRILSGLLAGSPAAEAIERRCGPA